ncbi:MAG: hypothetical protein JJT94_01880, partial [Bernardetiaceae bacterium]|nr:hypothetical protein [Bernardetiaceae bacterium]
MRHSQRRGVNTPSEEPMFDPGKDGAPSSEVPRDEMSYVLRYFGQNWAEGIITNDYDAIGGHHANLLGPAFAAGDVYADFIGFNDIGDCSTGIYNRQNLYNGNITAMTTRIKRFGSAVSMNYQYDQLQRITAAESRVWNPGAGGWQTPTTPTNTAYCYDQNGNLQSLKRIENGTIIDDLTYGYDPAINPNKLESVTENGDPTIGLDASYTYQYDAIGNITQITPAGGGVTTWIQWNLYGKIARVSKSDGTVIIYGYDASGNRIKKEVYPSTGDATITHYIRDASGNIMAVYQDFKLHEQPIYGASRLGQHRPTYPNDNGYTLTLGEKIYELSNHLGNVLVTLTDNIEQTARLVSATDYYPFG